MKRNTKLAAGQAELATLIDLERAHDVRTLRPCLHCGGLGNFYSMIEAGEKFYHGRCFAARHGVPALLALPADQLGKLMLGDLGTALALACFPIADKRRRPKPKRRR